MAITRRKFLKGALAAPAVVALAVPKEPEKLPAYGHSPASLKNLEIQHVPFAHIGSPHKGSAFQQLYREEFIRGFEQRQSELRKVADDMAVYGTGVFRVKA